MNPILIFITLTIAIIAVLYFAFRALSFVGDFYVETRYGLAYRLKHLERKIDTLTDRFEAHEKFTRTNTLGLADQVNDLRSCTRILESGRNYTNRKIDELWSLAASEDDVKALARRVDVLANSANPKARK